jgi:hypothetical protein
MCKAIFLALFITIVAESNSQVIVDSSRNRKFKSVLVANTKLTYHYYACDDSLGDLYTKTYVAECIKKIPQAQISEQELNINNYQCAIYDSVLLGKICDTIIGKRLKGKQSLMTFNFINILSQKLTYAFLIKTRKINRIAKSRRLRNKYSIQGNGVFKDDIKNSNMERYILKRILATKNKNGEITITIW